jgi:rhodanese-related sulfurtransferase
MNLGKKMLFYLMILSGISVLPAILLLARDGFNVPISIPFGITPRQELAQSVTVLWIDARPDVSFKSEHIPGAINLNRENWDTALAGLFKSYSPGAEIVVYCSSGCSESQEIADRIRNLGFDPVLVLEGGFEAWQAVHSKL